MSIKTEGFDVAAASSKMPAISTALLLAGMELNRDDIVTASKPTLLVRGYTLPLSDDGERYLRSYAEAYWPDGDAVAYRLGPLIESHLLRLTMICAE